MSSEKNKRVLEKIIRHIENTMGYCEGVTFDSFMDNRMLQEACIFNILQVGELSKLGLEEVFTKQYPDIQWNQMYGMRNRLVHDYEGIRLRIVWETISNDFPPLKAKLELILADMS